jgi:hypothetical protein
MEKGPAKLKTTKAPSRKEYPLKYDYFGQHKSSSNMHDLLQADKLI